MAQEVQDFSWGRQLVQEGGRPLARPAGEGGQTEAPWKRLRSRVGHNPAGTEGAFPAPQALSWPPGSLWLGLVCSLCEEGDLPALGEGVSCPLPCLPPGKDSSLGISGALGLSFLSSFPLQPQSPAGASGPPE